MNEPKLTYVLKADDILELEEVSTELLHLSSHDGSHHGPTRADCQRLHDRLALLLGRAYSCPEMRESPPIPHIEGDYPLTKEEIMALHDLAERLVVLLPPNMCDPEADEQDGNWSRAYLRVQLTAPADLALLRASLRKVLMFTDSPNRKNGKITLALRTRAPKKQVGVFSSDPEGWLEYLLSFSHDGSGAMPFVIGCIQRTLYSKPEFHS